MTRLEVKNMLVEWYKKNILVHQKKDKADIFWIDNWASQALGIKISNRNEISNQKVSLSFVNHLNKLLAFLDTNNKTQMERNAVESAIYEFVKLTIDRSADNIRSAYLSFTRPRKQKLIKSESNPEARRGRPNLFSNDDYKKIVNKKKK